MDVVDRRVAAWVDLVGDLLARSPDGFPRPLLERRLHETFDCQVSWNWMDPGAAPGFTVHIPMPGWPSPGALSDMSAAIGHHPLVRWFAATGEMRPMSIGRVPKDMVTARGRSVIREHLKPVGMEEQLSIPYRLGRGHYRAFVLARAGRDFTDEESETARQLQPLLRLVDRQYRVARRCPDAAGKAELSGREIAVLQLLADGLTASSIAGRLAVSPRTVHRHLNHVYRKLGVCDRVRAVLAARESGLLSDGTPEVAAASGRPARGPGPEVVTPFAGARDMPAL